MILLIDFEATGIDPRTAQIIEIGAVVVDDGFNVCSTEDRNLFVSALVKQPGVVLTPEVEAVTHITQAMLDADGIPLDTALDKLGDLMEGVDYAIAYNRSYDEVLFKHELDRSKLFSSNLQCLRSIPWLCAMADIEANYKFKSWKQMHIALDHGVSVHPKELHRAIADVELMRKILVASGTTVHEMYTFQQDPWVYLAAECKAPWLDNKASTNLAKEHGYAWEQARGDYDGRRFEKTWVKRVKQKNVNEERHKCPLKLKELI